MAEFGVRYLPSRIKTPAASARTGKYAPRLRIVGMYGAKPERMSQAARHTIPVLFVILSDDLLRDIFSSFS
jgi:hypothetical protein